MKRLLVAGKRNNYAALKRQRTQQVRDLDYRSATNQTTACRHVVNSVRANRLSGVVFRVEMERNLLGLLLLQAIIYASTQNRKYINLNPCVPFCQYCSNRLKSRDLPTNDGAIW